MSEKKTMTFQEKLFQLAEDMVSLAQGFTKDGYNPSQSYEYVRAQQYKTIFFNALHKNRLRHKLDDAVCEVSQTLKSDKMILTQYHGVLTIFDVDSEGKETYMIWSQGSDNLDKGLSKAKTLALKDFIKSNYLVSDGSDDPEEDTSTTIGAKKKFMNPMEKKNTIDKVVKNTSPATAEQIERIKNAIIAIRLASQDDNYGVKTEKELEDGITSTRAEVIITKVEMKGNEYGLEI